MTKMKSKKFLGMPMQWDYKNAFKDLWNARENRIFPPKRFGIGWSLNFHALLKKAKLIK
jgi:hypothetical protein